MSSGGGIADKPSKQCLLLRCQKPQIYDNSRECVNFSVKENIDLTLT